MESYFFLLVHLQEVDLDHHQVVVHQAVPVHHVHLAAPPVDHQVVAVMHPETKPKHQKDLESKFYMNFNSVSMCTSI